MAELDGTVNFSDGELVGELGGVVIGGGEKPFVIPITTSKDSSGKTVYSTTVMFKDIEEAYKTGKRILLHISFLGEEIDIEVVGASVTQMSSYSTGGPEILSIDKLAMICDLMPGESYPEKDEMFSATIYEFSYGANGATVTTNAVSIPTYDVINRVRSHIGMIIHSTTLDTMAKVIAIYGGTKWEKIEDQDMPPYKVVYIWERTE